MKGPGWPDIPFPTAGAGEEVLYVPPPGSAACEAETTISRRTDPLWAESTPSHSASSIAFPNPPQRMIQPEGGSDSSQPISWAGGGWPGQTDTHQSQ